MTKGRPAVDPSPRAVAFMERSIEIARETARQALSAGCDAEDLVILVVNTNVPRLARIAKDLGMPAVRGIGCAAVKLSELPRAFAPEVLAMLEPPPPPGLVFVCFLATMDQRLCGTLPVEPSLGPGDPTELSPEAHLLAATLAGLSRAARYDAALVALADVTGLWDAWIAGLADRDAARRLGPIPALGQSTLTAWARGQGDAASLRQAAAAVEAAIRSIMHWIDADAPPGAEDLATVSSIACTATWNVLLAAIEEETKGPPSGRESDLDLSDGIIAAAAAIDRAAEIRFEQDGTAPPEPYMDRWLSVLESPAGPVLH